MSGHSGNTGFIPFYTGISYLWESRTLSSAAIQADYNRLG